MAMFAEMLGLSDPIQGHFDREAAEADQLAFDLQIRRGRRLDAQKYSDTKVIVGRDAVLAWAEEHAAKPQPSAKPKSSAKRVKPSNVPSDDVVTVGAECMQESAGNHSHHCARDNREENAVAESINAIATALNTPATNLEYA